MNEKDVEINTRLMEELGLEPGFRQRLYDHDTGDMRKIRGREIVAPGCIPGNNAVEFDPINSPRMMNFFFGSYLSTLSTTGIIDGDVISFATVPTNGGKMRASVKIDPYDGGPIEEISSKPYSNETTCVADLICRINGDDDVDMSQYDYDRRKVAITPLKAPTKQRRGKK